jgi:hypothetical protein
MTLRQCDNACLNVHYNVHLNMYYDAHLNVNCDVSLVNQDLGLLIPITASQDLFLIPPPSLGSSPGLPRGPYTILNDILTLTLLHLLV